MRCLTCDADCPPAARFCNQCGAALSAACSGCGHANPPGSRFCAQCGASLTVAGAPSSGIPAPTDYTPRPLAEKILAGRTAMEGERKLVTVLSADVAGFTAMAESLDAETCFELMQRCCDLMLEAVHRYEGTVTQFLGDGILALFGAPIAHEDHAQRAILAGLGIQGALRSYQEELQRTRGIQFQMRVGLNSGPVVVGTIGSDLSMTYTAIGDTVNLAARVQGLAEPGTVLISEHTYRLARGYVVTRDLGEHSVRGKAIAVGVYEVLRPRHRRSRVEVAAERGLSPFVGRERDLATLQECYGKVRAGSGRIVVVSGAAGIGKSRLLHEFRRSLDGANLTWLEGRCISYGHDIPYLPIIDLLKDSFAIEESDTAEAIVRKVDAGTEAWGGAAGTGVAFLKSLLAVDPGDAAVAAMDPQMRKARIFEALRDLWIAAAGTRPLVVVLEDLHWIDPLSEAFLAYALEVVPDQPIFLILTHRPEHVVRFGSPVSLAKIELCDLSERESAALAAGLLGSDAVPAELRRLIHGKAEGNPFVVEEVIRSLLETGALRREAAGYVLARPVEEIRVPDTVQDVIMARLDRLDEEPKRTLQMAAVIGREFSSRVLESVTSPMERLEDHLRALTASELIYERAAPLARPGVHPELTYQFQHTLTHEVAYSSLLLARRKILHQRVGETIEEIYGDRLTEQYETLAYHFERAEAREKALEYLLKSGEKALAAFAPQQAVSFYDRALVALRGEGQPLSPEGVTALHHNRGQGLFLMGAWDRCADSFQAMLRCAQEAGDAGQEGVALFQLSLTCMWAHRLEECIEYGERAHRLGKITGNPVVLAGSLLVMAVVHTHTGDVRDLETARQEAVEGLRIAQEAGLPPFHAMALGALGHIHYYRGDYSRAVEHTEEAVRIGRRYQLPLNLLWALWDDGLGRCGRGDYAQALSALQEALRLALRFGDQSWRGRVLNTLGWLYTELCHWDKAIQHNAQSAAEANAIGFPEIFHNAELNLADCYLALGQLEESQRHLETVHQPSIRGDVWEGCYCRYTQHLNASLGELWLARGDTEKALTFADACLTAAEATLSRRNIVKGRRLKGEAFLAMGRLDEAEAELDTAVRVGREVGNPAQIWKTLAALGRLRHAQGRAEDARATYREALAVVEGVAAGLSDPELRATLLASPQVSALRQAAG